MVISSIHIDLTVRKLINYIKVLHINYIKLLI